MVDEGTRKTLSSIPLLKTKAGPRDKELWVTRLKEEYQALIKETVNFKLQISQDALASVEELKLTISHCQAVTNILCIVNVACVFYVQNNKEADNDWFRLESDKTGTKWFGKCWYVHNLLKYEFDLEFDIPVTYPTTAPELTLPGLDGKTAKMYRGGKICLTDHFKPLWARNVPRFGIAHAMALGLGPWLAVEIPDLIEKGAVKYQEKTEDAK